MLSLIHRTGDAAALERAIDEEFESHIGECAADLVAAGHSEAEATALARQRFGDFAVHAGACRREAPDERFPSVNHCLRSIHRARSSTGLQLLAVCMRYGLGGVLVLGACLMSIISVEPGAGLGGPESDRLRTLFPIAQLAEAVIGSSLLWAFLGAVQAFAGALLITQRFAKIGAVIAFAILLNLLVVALAFNLERIGAVFALLLIADLSLLIWDLDSFQPLFRKPQRVIACEPEAGALADARWSWIGIAMVLATAGGYAMQLSPLLMLAFGFLIAAVGVVAFPFSSNSTRSLRAHARPQHD
jgi:hypothetical protein